MCQCKDCCALVMICWILAVLMLYDFKVARYIFWRVKVVVCSCFQVLVWSCTLSVTCQLPHV